MGPHPGPGLGGHVCGGMGRGWRCRLINMSPFIQSYPQSFSLHLLGPLPFPSFFSLISVSLLPTEPVREHTGTTLIPAGAERSPGTPGDRSAIPVSSVLFLSPHFFSFQFLSPPTHNHQVLGASQGLLPTWLLKKSWGGEERILSRWGVRSPGSEACVCH